MTCPPHHACSLELRVVPTHLKLNTLNLGCLTQSLAQPGTMTIPGARSYAVVSMLTGPVIDDHRVLPMFILLDLRHTKAFENDPQDSISATPLWTVAHSRTTASNVLPLLPNPSRDGSWCILPRMARKCRIETAASSGCDPPRWPVQSRTKTLKHDWLSAESAS